MKVLVVSTMFPSSTQPVHAVFVYRRVLHVARQCDVRVLAPVPFFPFATLLRRYAHRKGIPRRDSLGGLQVLYPRFLSIPKFLKPLDGVFLFATVAWCALRMKRDFDFDLIEAQLAYPDGFAGLLLSKLLKKPLTVTLRGHDINVTPRFLVRRKQVAAVLRGAQRVISVADALRREAVRIGCPEERTETIPNAVDTTLFYPLDRAEARRRLRLPSHRRIVLSVGHLVERKGYHVVLDALYRMRQRYGMSCYYVIVGGPGEEGNFLPEIERRIRRYRLQEDVLLAGSQNNEQLCPWYGAADVFCLASDKEGWANVLLESLACGTPVVATRVWGTPEVISSPDYGILVERTPESIANGLRRALQSRWDRETLVRYAGTFTWTDVARKTIRNYRLALDSFEPLSTLYVTSAGAR